MASVSLFSLDISGKHIVKIIFPDNSEVSKLVRWHVEDSLSFFQVSLYLYSIHFVDQAEEMLLFLTLSKYNLCRECTERWWAVQILLNEKCVWMISFSFFRWCELSNPSCRPFDVALHCLAERQEIEREDQGSVSEGKKSWRTGRAAQHVRVFWDTTHGNEVALHDLRGPRSESVRIHGAKKQERLF